jgi:hypothetical protein
MLFILKLLIEILLIYLEILNTSVSVITNIYSIYSTQKKIEQLLFNDMGNNELSWDNYISYLINTVFFVLREKK